MTKRLFHYLSAGLFSGLILALVEGVDRSLLLAHNFSSISEKILFLSSLTLIPAGNLIIATLLIALSSLSIFLTKLTLKENAPGKSRAQWIVQPVTAVGMSIPLILLALFAPAIFSNGFRAILSGVSERLAAVKPIVTYSTLLLSLVIFVIMLLFSFIDSERFEKLLSRQALSIAIIFTLIFASAGFYWLDSRMFVGRYQYFFHIPATIMAVFLTFIAGTIIATKFEKHRLSLPLLAIFSIITFGSSLYSIFSIDKSDSVKALFWRRGVIAKKYVAFTQHLIDFDRDGFSSFWGGGDCNDRDKNINPLAANSCLTPDPKALKVDFSDLNQTPLPEKHAKNVLFITIDCLRADNLGTYGYKRNTSPNLDRFASRSIVFENAYSLGTNTGHSFSAIARSSYGEAIFDDAIPTVAEALAANNYETAAITSPKTDEWLWKQGWESYKTIMMKGLKTLVHNKGGYWNSKKLTDKSIEYFNSNKDKPFYVWIHYNDLHAKNEKYVKQGNHDFGSMPVDIYDSNLAFTDEHLGRLLEYLETSGLLENTIVAISADHGEEFLEHGQQFHNGRPYRVQTHVPLILWYPGAKATRISKAVSDIDLGPTFLRGVGQLPSRSYSGLDLMQTAAGSAADRQIFMETPRNVPEGDFFAWAMVDGDWRLIYDLIGNTFELYNQAKDPLEQHNLIDIETDKANSLKAAMGQWLMVQSQHKNYRKWTAF